MVIEQLLCHPRLPLIAGVEPEGPAVHVWDGELRELATLGEGARSPVWHPEEPRLLVATDAGVRSWSPGGGIEPVLEHPYRAIGLGPGGRTLLARPSAAKGEGHDLADVIDLGDGTRGDGPDWDTGVVVHPAGGLFATLRSDQGATLVVFGRTDGARVRLLRRALIIEVDGYTAPLFSPDGRYFAVRGNAYAHTLYVYEFPSLRRVLQTVLGRWDEGWSRHNVAFAPDLFVGTPSGLDSRCTGPVTALAATATGEIVVAGAGGELVLLPATQAPPAAGPETVRAFLASTEDVPEDAELEEEFELTDGERTWGPGDLETVLEAGEQDPAWLQIQARMNALRSGADAAD
ncbi:hypothetical protein ACPPVO_12045 [Dactylosporangium sp. McL0621]|uniref:hypothetical protein n=1 Tax=Dactylosporangium sp. McL0621 TaxID=3415678 RepID=UPI003CE8F443